MPTGDSVATKAKWYHDVNYRFPTGFCLGFSRRCAGAPGGTYDARNAWYNAKYRHTSIMRSAPPRGSFVYWRGGLNSHGHVAISAGDGFVWSTDVRRRGYVDRVSLVSVTTGWNMPYLGWTEDINGVRVSGLIAPAPITVRLANLKPGLRNDDVKDLQRALIKRGWKIPAGPTGYYGEQTKDAVRRFERHQGWPDANGLIGAPGCHILGLKVIS